MCGCLQFNILSFPIPFRKATLVRLEISKPLFLGLETLRLTQRAEGRGSGGSRSQVRNTQRGCSAKVFHILPGHAKDDTRILSTLAQNLQRMSPSQSSCTVRIHMFQTRNDSAGAAHAAPRPAPYLQRAPCWLPSKGSVDLKSPRVGATGRAILASRLPVRLPHPGHLPRSVFLHRDAPAFLWAI